MTSKNDMSETKFTFTNTSKNESTNTVVSGGETDSVVASCGVMGVFCEYEYAGIRVKLISTAIVIATNVLILWFILFPSPTFSLS